MSQESNDRQRKEGSRRKGGVLGMTGQVSFHLTMGKLNLKKNNLLLELGLKLWSLILGATYTLSSKNLSYAHS